MALGLSRGIPFKHNRFSLSSYWATLISAVVEDAAPNDFVLTFASGKPSLDETDFTIAGFPLTNAVWAGAVLTLTSSVAVVYGNAPVITFVPSGGTANVTNNVAAEAELTTYITGLATPLSSGQLVKLNTLILALKSGLSITDLDDAFDLFYVLGGETEESSLKNLVSNAYHCTNVSATSFTALEGFTSDGAADYLNTGWKPKSHGVNFALDDCSMGVYSRSDIAENGVSIGVRKASADDRTFLQLRTAGNLASAPINTDATTLQTVSCFNSKGLFVNCRTASNVTVFYKNVKPFLSTVNNSNDRPNYNFVISALNTADSIALFSTKQLSIVFTGKAFTESQIRIITDSCETYMVSNGKGVIETGEIPLINRVGYCWFTSPRAIYNATANKTWIGIVHDDGSGYSQHILQLDNTSGVLSKFEVGTIVEYDDHNEPSVLIRSSDNKLFIAYTEHGKVGSPIRYRLSTNALDGTAWGAESTVDPSSSVYTYCNAFEAANGDIYIFFREGSSPNHYWNYIKSVDGGVTFSDDIRIVDNNYLRCFQNPGDKDIIHFVVSAHPNMSVDPNTVTHFYFDCADDKCYDSAGTDITASIPLIAANMTTIFTNAHPEQQWVEDIIVDASGNPRVLMTYFPSYTVTPNLKFLYYSEWTGLAWTTPYEIHQTMNKNIGLDTIVNTYPGLAHFDRADPDRIFASKEVSTVMEIFELTRVAADNFTSVQKTTLSDSDQWRPFTVASPNRNVFWLNKVRYNNYYNDFNQQLVCKTL